MSPRISRYRFLLLIGLFIGCSTIMVERAPAQQAQQEPSLRDRLVFGLKARFPGEITFLEQLAAQVEAGNIPAQIVDETFFYVRQNYSDKRNPFYYFLRIMRLKASPAGVTLPAYTGPFR